MPLPAHMRKARSRADGRSAAGRGGPSKYVPAAVLAVLRPNRGQAHRWPVMGEDTPHTGLLALVRAEIARRPALSCFHTRFALGSDVGYPDLTIWGPGGILWAELKGSDGRVTMRQLATVNAIRAAGGRAVVWWPEDYHLGLVDDVLDALCVPAAGLVALPPLGSPAGLVVAGPARRPRDPDRT